MNRFLPVPGSVTAAIPRSALLPLPDGRYAAKTPQGDVLSIQPDGSLQTRPIDAIGPWESGALEDGNKWVVSDSAYPTGAYALLVVD